MKKLWIVLLFLSLFNLSGEEVAPTPAPSFANPDLDNQFYIATRSLGQKWILLDFFATWCEPCHEELPHLEELALDYDPEILDVLVVAVDVEGRDVVVPFFQNRPTVLRVLIDRYQKTAQSYGVSESIPVLVLIDPQGNIVFRKVGFDPEEGLSELRAFLDSHL